MIKLILYIHLIFHRGNLALICYPKLSYIVATINNLLFFCNKMLLCETVTIKCFFILCLKMLQDCVCDERYANSYTSQITCVYVYLYFPLWILDFFFNAHDLKVKYDYNDIMEELQILIKFIKTSTASSYNKKCCQERNLNSHFNAKLSISVVKTYFLGFFLLHSRSFPLLKFFEFWNN